MTTKRQSDRRCPPACSRGDSGGQDNKDQRQRVECPSGFLRKDLRRAVYPRTSIVAHAARKGSGSDTTIRTAISPKGMDGNSQVNRRLKVSKDQAVT